MGTTIREVVFDIGGGIPNGKKFKAVLVSYTHLDVYKRQDLNGEHQLAALLRELCKLDFHWIRLHYLYPDDITDEPVSYTHLDVYKRQRLCLRAP